MGRYHFLPIITASLVYLKLRDEISFGGGGICGRVFYTPLFFPILKAGVLGLERGEGEKKGSLFFLHRSDRGGRMDGIGHKGLFFFFFFCLVLLHLEIPRRPRSLVPMKFMLSSVLTCFLLLSALITFLFIVTCLVVGYIFISLHQHIHAVPYSLHTKKPRFSSPVALNNPTKLPPRVPYPMSHAVHFPFAQNRVATDTVLVYIYVWMWIAICMIHSPSDATTVNR
jgi:hypothetical protein